jgi:hypothetical protein
MPSWAGQNHFGPSVELRCTARSPPCGADMWVPRAASHALACVFPLSRWRAGPPRQPLPRARALARSPHGGPWTSVVSSPTENAVILSAPSAKPGSAPAAQVLLPRDHGLGHGLTHLVRDRLAGPMWQPHTPHRHGLPRKRIPRAPDSFSIARRQVRNGQRSTPQISPFVDHYSSDRTLPQPIKHSPRSSHLLHRHLRSSRRDRGQSPVARVGLQLGHQRTIRVLRKPSVGLIGSRWSGQREFLTRASTPPLGRRSPWPGFTATPYAVRWPSSSSPSPPLGLAAVNFGFEVMERRIGFSPAGSPPCSCPWVLGCSCGEEELALAVGSWWTVAIRVRRIPSPHAIVTVGSYLGAPD